MAAAVALNLLDHVASMHVSVRLSLGADSESHRTGVDCDPRVADTVVEAMSAEAQGVHFEDWTKQLADAEARIENGTGTVEDLVMLAAEDAYLARGEVRESDEPGMPLQSQDLPAHVYKDPQGRPIVCLVFSRVPVRQEVKVRVSTVAEAEAVSTVIEEYRLRFLAEQEGIRDDVWQDSKCAVDSASGVARDYALVARLLGHFERDKVREGEGDQVKLRDVSKSDWPPLTFESADGTSCI